MANLFPDLINSISVISETIAEAGMGTGKLFQKENDMPVT